jgi:hypothetical protein
MDEADGRGTAAKAEQTRTCRVCCSTLMVKSFREFCPVCVLQGALTPVLRSSYGRVRKTIRLSKLSRLPHRFENYELAHIVPVAGGGGTNLENLALACVSCSLRKGARLLVRDPNTNEELAIFHPRLHLWRAHFRWDGVSVVGITPTGRATVAALSMNRPLALVIREEEAHRGRGIRRKPIPK